MSEMIGCGYCAHEEECPCRIIKKEKRDKGISTHDIAKDCKEYQLHPMVKGGNKA